MDATWVAAVGAAIATAWLVIRLIVRGESAAYDQPEQLPPDLLEAGKNKWEKLVLLERHLDAHKMTTCEAMVVAHEQITALDPEYVNLFTVQHNLFAGALLALSDEPTHLAVAREAKHGRARGCFALTEVDAGVYSGAIVNTELRCEGDTFELHTPSPEADKCWISYAADDEVTWIVVMAKYKPADGDKSNEVVVPLLVEKAAKGIEITDYVDDQICFKLNRFGRIRFQHARVPFTALMNRFVKWNPSAKKMEFDGSRRALLYKMFDRLLVGRLVLSATAVHGAHQTALLVREHALKKGFWSNLAVRNKVEGALRECGTMQRALHLTARLLDEGKAAPWQINFLKASIPPRCLALISDLATMLGGRIIRASCSVLSLHASIYGAVVAEGDSAILAQSFCKDILLAPWKASWDPYFCAMCLFSAARVALAKDKRKEWDRAQPLLMAAFHRLSHLTFRHAK